MLDLIEMLKDALKDHINERGSLEAKSVDGTELMKLEEKLAALQEMFGDRLAQARSISKELSSGLRVIEGGLGEGE